MPLPPTFYDHGSWPGVGKAGEASEKLSIPTANRAPVPPKTTSIAPNITSHDAVHSQGPYNYVGPASGPPPTSRANKAVPAAAAALRINPYLSSMPWYRVPELSFSSAPITPENATFAADGVYSADPSPQLDTASYNQTGTTWPASSSVPFPVYGSVTPSIGQGGTLGGGASLSDMNSFGIEAARLRREPAIVPSERDSGIFHNLFPAPDSSVSDQYLYERYPVDPLTKLGAHEEVTSVLPELLLQPPPRLLLPPSPPGGHALTTMSYNTTKTAQQKSPLGLSYHSESDRSSFGDVVPNSPFATAASIADDDAVGEEEDFYDSEAEGVDGTEKDYNKDIDDGDDDDEDDELVSNESETKKGSLLKEKKETPQWIFLASERNSEPTVFSRHRAALHLVQDPVKYTTVKDDEPMVYKCMTPMSSAHEEKVAPLFRILAEKKLATETKQNFQRALARRRTRGGRPETASLVNYVGRISRSRLKSRLACPLKDCMFFVAGVATKSLLVEHVRSSHAATAGTICTVCMKSFSRPDALRRHVTTIHRGDGKNTPLRLPAARLAQLVAENFTIDPDADSVKTKVPSVAPQMVKEVQIARVGTRMLVIREIAIRTRAIYTEGYGSSRSLQGRGPGYDLFSSNSRDAMKTRVRDLNEDSPAHTIRPVTTTL